MCQYILNGTNDVLRPGSLLIRPGNVYARIGKEIDTARYQPNKALDLMNDLRDTIINLREEMLKDELNIRSK